MKHAKQIDNNSEHVWDDKAGLIVSSLYIQPIFSFRCPVIWQIATTASAKRPNQIRLQGKYIDAHVCPIYMQHFANFHGPRPPTRHAHSKCTNYTRMQGKIHGSWEMNEMKAKESHWNQEIAKRKYVRAAKKWMSVNKKQSPTECEFCCQ